MMVLMEAEQRLAQARDTFQLTHSAADRLAYDQAVRAVVIAEARLNVSVR